MAGRFRGWLEWWGMFQNLMTAIGLGFSMIVGGYVGLILLLPTLGRGRPDDTYDIALSIIFGAIIGGICWKVVENRIKRSLISNETRPLRTSGRVVGKNRWQYSLSALMLAITAICVIVGIARNIPVEAIVPVTLILAILTGMSIVILRG